MDLNLEPGKVADLSPDIYAVVRGNKIHIVGPTITYREVDMSDGEPKWIDDLNIRNSLYYLHVDVVKEPTREIVIDIHEWVMHDGQKHLTASAPVRIPLQDAEAHDKQQTKMMTAGPPVVPATIDAPAAVPAPPTQEKELLLMYDVPEPTGEVLEKVQVMASTANLKLAKAMVNSMEESDENYQIWQQVCNFLAKPKIVNKFYVALKNSKFRGKELEGQVLIEIADFLEELSS